MRRRAICFDVHGCAQTPIPDQLSDYNWTLDVADNTEEVLERVARHPYRIGVAILSAKASVSQVHELLQQTCELMWIVLITKDLLDSSIASGFIRELCYDFHTLPPDPHRLAITLGRAYGMAKLPPVSETVSPHGLQGILASSDVMQAFLARLRRIASSDFDVLILGESGSGKELAARAIHAESANRDGQVIVVDCNTLPEQLLYSELFGHEKGAFTGAAASRVGKVELAHGGTLVLDEIGSLPISQQPHFLRFLEERTLTRLGSDEIRFVDTRVICTTNQDVDQLVAAGVLRKDLYFRIDGVRLHVPPLRERNGDIVLLVQHFLDEYHRENGVRFSRGLTKDALRLLRAYDWPGNVRELQNVVRRVGIMHKGRSIRPQDLRLGITDVEQVPLLERARATAELETLRHAITSCRGNLSKAARAVGLSRVSFYRLMRKHNLSASV